MQDPKAHLKKAVAEIDQAELAIRLIEIGCKMKRADGSTGKEAWSEVVGKAVSGEVPAYIVADFYKMAEAAILYFGECADSAQTTN